MTERIPITSLAQLKQLAGDLWTQDPVEVVHIVGSIARFTKILSWDEETKQWWIDGDGIYTDEELEQEGILLEAMKQGTLFAKIEVDWEKPFPIASISRKDLVKVDIPKDQAAMFTDEEMQSIASRMTGYYDAEDYWQHLADVVNAVLQTKG